MRRLAVLAVSLALAGPALGGSISDRVKDGPAAALIRESLKCLESGENEPDEDAKVEWYERGKKLAEEAIHRDENDPNAHFALFANWGRALQTRGWLRNAHHLPAVRRALDRTLELQPDHSAALAAKGGLYLKLPRVLGGSAEKAEPLLRRAVDLDPNAVGARLELAECYAQTERQHAARKVAVEALKLAEVQGKHRFVARARELLEELGDTPRARR